MGKLAGLSWDQAIIDEWTFKDNDHDSVQDYSDADMMQAWLTMIHGPSYNSQAHFLEAYQLLMPPRLKMTTRATILLAVEDQYAYTELQFGRLLGKRDAVHKAYLSLSDQARTQAHPASLLRPLWGPTWDRAVDSCGQIRAAVKASLLEGEDVSEYWTVHPTALEQMAYMITEEQIEKLYRVYSGWKG